MRLLRLLNRPWRNGTPPRWLQRMNYNAARRWHFKRTGEWWVDWKDASNTGSTPDA